MANTIDTFSMRMDTELKANLKELLNELELDMTTFFNMAAAQAVREQALPFHPALNNKTVGKEE